MLPLKKFCALFLLAFFLSGLATAVLASGKECAQDSECPTGERCCCCKANQECPGTAGEKGRCFAKEVITGRQLVPVDSANLALGMKEELLKKEVLCPGVICPLSTHTSVEDFIMEAVNYIFYLSIILAPLMIIIGAAVFLTSAGNPKQTKLGASIIQWTAIGFAIILFARGITAIIKMILVG